MDTIQIIKINESQLLITLNSKEAVKLNLKFKDLKSIIRKIKFNILDNYIISGPKENKLSELKEISYELFNILNFFNFKNLFSQLKKNTFNQIELIVDEHTNQIPFELLNDGKDFLSDFIIFSRSFIGTSNKYDNDSSIKLNEPFSVICNPSESNDIMIETNDECDYIAELINPFFDLRGPYKKRYVNKIELIHLLGISSCLHFSGHYKNDSQENGWELFDDLFTSSDIQKISKAPDFVFSNTCGGSSDFFISSFLNKGSKSIIASLGNLPSKKASEFSQKFYNYFINDNISLGESLFLAKRDMIKSYGKKDLFWCFYQIYGSSSLIINKKYKKKNKEKSKYLQLFLFSLLFLSFLFIFNFFKNKSSDTLDSSVLKQLIIKSNNKIINSFTASELDSLHSIKLDNGEFIYFNSINNNPVFSLNENFEGLDLFIHNDDNVQKLFDYKNDTLNLFFKNKLFYDDYKYHHIHLYLGDKYKNIEVYIKKIDIDTLNYELFLFDKNNYNRYKITLNELVYYSKIYDVITINELDRLADPTTAFSYGFSDKFDLIKDAKFNKELHLYIKKALLK